MNSQNVEKAKKILVPSLLTIGGLWYYALPILYGFWKFGKFKPTNEKLEKAWEGFEYDPQINTIQTLHQIFKRSATLQKEIMPEFTILSKKLRQSSKLEELDEFISSVKQEIDQKIHKSRMCLMDFLQYKNHSFEEFYQKNFVEQNDELLIQLIVEFDIQLFISYDSFKYKLPTINQCIDYMKKIIPIITEKKPQFDRLRHIIIYFLHDLLIRFIRISSSHQVQTLVTTIKLTNFKKIKPNQRVEAETLLEDYKQLCQSIVQ